MQRYPFEMWQTIISSKVPLSPTRYIEIYCVYGANSIFFKEQSALDSWCDLYYASYLYLLKYFLKHIWGWVDLWAQLSLNNNAHPKEV